MNSNAATWSGCAAQGSSPYGEPCWGGRPLNVVALLLNPSCLVAGRGKPRSPARQAGPTVGLTDSTPDRRKLPM